VSIPVWEKPAIGSINFLALHSIPTSVPAATFRTGDTLDPARRRRGLAVEPMTCAPNAFASGEGLLVLEPGESFIGRWGICPNP